jgi:hypothetical protein
MTVALIGAAAVLIAACIGAGAVVYARRRRDAIMEPVAAVPKPKARVELDVDVPEQRSWPWPDPPVAEIKMRNRGDDTAFLKRLTIEVEQAGRIDVLDALSPYSYGGGPARLGPSAEYRVELPPPERAAGTRLDVDISHVVAPRDGELIRVMLRRAVTEEPGSRFLVYGGSGVYLLQLTITYNGSDQKADFRPIAVVCPANILYVPSPEGMTHSVRGFGTKVRELRQEIDQEMIARGRPAPDWAASAPRRDDLPADLAVFDPAASAGRTVNDNFWDPAGTVTGYLQAAERVCRQIIKTVPTDMPDGLAGAAAFAQETLDQLPALRTQLLQNFP